MNWRGSQAESRKHYLSFYDVGKVEVYERHVPLFVGNGRISNRACWVYARNQRKTCNANSAIHGRRIQDALHGHGGRDVRMRLVVLQFKILKLIVKNTVSTGLYNQTR